MNSVTEAVRRGTSLALARACNRLSPGTGTGYHDQHNRFLYDGAEFPLFCHGHNCGFPNRRMTERSAELVIADRWLDRVDGAEVWEIGAVTPYYWPGRVKNVVDPADPHRLVGLRESIFDVDLTGRRVLSISTLEHIGLREYGRAEVPGQAVQAFRKILAESPWFLVTVPVGYNRALDYHLAAVASDPPPGLRVGYLVRTPGRNDWRQVGRDEAAGAEYEHGMSPHRWANGLTVLQRDRD